MVSSLKITVSNDRYLVQLELPGFAPEDFSLKSRGDAIVLEAKHQGKAGGDEVTSRYDGEGDDINQPTSSENNNTTVETDNVSLLTPGKSIARTLTVAKCKKKELSRCPMLS